MNPNPFGKYINPANKDTRAHINQHVYPVTGDLAHKENNSFLHDDMQGLLSLLTSVLGGGIGFPRIGIGSCCKDYCASGQDAGIPEDTPLTQIITVYSTGETGQVWLRLPSIAPLSIVPSVKAKKNCDCCGAVTPTDPEPGADELAVIAGFERGNETLYTTQVQGIEFGDLVGFTSPQTGQIVLQGAPFLTLEPFIHALQNYITETPGIYGIVEATLSNIGQYTLTVRESNIEITQMHKTVGTFFSWATLETRAAINAVISPLGSIGDFVRAAIDSGNDGTREFESPWVANTAGLLINADIPILDGDKVIVEVSADQSAVLDTAEIIIPNTDALVYKTGSDRTLFIADIDFTFDPNLGKEFSIYILDELGQRINANSPLQISPADDSYQDVRIEFSSLGITNEGWGLELIASSIGLAENHPHRLFYLIDDDPNQTPGSYDSSYDNSYA